jgi:hypothetical protein
MAAFRIAFAFCAASTVFGQTDNRTFHLTTPPNLPALREIATIIRVIAGNKPVTRSSGASGVTVDEAKFDITVSGTDADLTLSAWLVKQLDTTTPEPAQYAIPGGSDAVRIFYAAHTPTQPLLNELLTSLRTVGDIQRIFTYSPPHAIVIRTGAARASMVDWLFHQLDVAADDQTRWQPREIEMPDIPGQFVKVDYLIHQTPPQGFYDIVTSLRAIVDVQAIFTRSTPQGIAFRGTAAKVQLADWLFQQLDVQPDNQMRAAQHEFAVPGASDVTRVYYLNTANLNGTATAVRSEANIQRIFVCSEPKAVSLRGTPEAMAIADRVIKEHDGAAAQ